MEKVKNVDCRENEQFNKLETITNRLLGNYVDSTYTIDKIISAELATMPKVIASDFNGKIFAESDTDSGKFTFEISFDIENRFANLYILERIVKANGYIVNTLRTLVSSVRCVSADMTEKAKKAFHVVTDGEVLSMSNYPNISTELNVKSRANQRYMAKIDELYGKLFVAKMGALNQQKDDFCDAVLNNFNDEHKKIEDYFLKDKNYKALCDLLQANIYMISGTSEQFVTQEQHLNNMLLVDINRFVLGAENIMRGVDKVRENVQKMTKSSNENVLSNEAKNTKIEKTHKQDEMDMEM